MQGRILMHFDKISAKLNVPLEWTLPLSSPTLCHPLELLTTKQHIHDRLSFVVS